MGMGRGPEPPRPPRPPRAPTAAIRGTGSGGGAVPERRGAAAPGQNSAGPSLPLGRARCPRRSPHQGEAALPGRPDLAVALTGTRIGPDPAVALTGIRTGPDPTGAAPSAETGTCPGPAGAFTRTRIWTLPGTDRQWGPRCGAGPAVSARGRCAPTGRCCP